MTPRSSAAYEAAPPDFVLLDIMMPKVNGYDVCRRIRARDPELPIIFLSAKSEEIDRVIGLELGADDYINKPFGIHELIARIRAVSRRCLRRRPSPEPQGFLIGGLQVIADELRALRGQEVIELSLREVQLLRLFADNVGVVLDRDRIFSTCWGIDHYPNSRTIDQHVAKLRKKIEADPRDPQIIRTVHGVGYRYEG
ncbi:MAG: response regulator transcription factor [Myxococcales bacterium]|nr:response regulator transcription factor [Myxococcales bacterium]